MGKKLKHLSFVDPPPPKKKIRGEGTGKKVEGKKREAGVYKVPYPPPLQLGQLIMYYTRKKVLPVAYFF